MQMKATVGMAARVKQAIDNGAFRDEGSVRTSFALIRHFVRNNDRSLAESREQLRGARRDFKKLGDSPFNRHRQNLMCKYIAALHEYVRSGRECQQTLGRIIIAMAPKIDAVTTMKQRLELLNCNPADRTELDEPDIGLIDLIFVYCVEDSAAHRGEDFMDRPMFNAVQAEMMRVMFDAPEGREASRQVFDEMFAPGGLLHGAPTYYRQPNGTMRRKAPSLVLHDAAGSRVIERTPS